MICGFLPFEDPNTSQLYKKILSADYKIPKSVSKDAQDMIKGILNTDPETRLTIEQIRNHPWYKQHEDKIYNGIIVGQDQIPVSDSLIKQMKQYDIESDYATKCVEVNKHNHVTATYHLLMKKSIKGGKITMQEAFEAKNDFTYLIRRQP